MGLRLALVIGLIMVPKLALPDELEECTHTVESYLEAKAGADAGAFDEKMDEFLKLKAAITLNKMAGLYLEGLTPGQSPTDFSQRIQNEIEEKEKALKRQGAEDTEFKNAAEAFRKAPLSRRALAEVMPYLQDALNHKRKDSAFDLKSDDLKIIGIVAKKEKEANEYSGRMTPSKTRDSGIINFASLINSAYVHSGNKNKSEEQVSKNTDKVRLELESLQKRIQKMDLVPGDLCPNASKEQSFDALIAAVGGLKEGGPRYCSKEKLFSLKTTAEDCSCKPLPGVDVKGYSEKTTTLCSTTLSKATKDCPVPFTLKVTDLSADLVQYYCEYIVPKAPHSNCLISYTGLLKTETKRKVIESGPKLCYGVPRQYRYKNRDKYREGDISQSKDWVPFISECGGSAANGVIEGAILLDFDIKDRVAASIQKQLNQPKSSQKPTPAEREARLKNLAVKLKPENWSWAKKKAYGILLDKVSQGKLDIDQLDDQEIGKRLDQSVAKANDTFDRIKKQFNEKVPGFLDSNCWDWQTKAGSEGCGLISKVMGAVLRDAALTVGGGVLVTAATGGMAGPAVAVAGESLISGSVTRNLKKYGSEFAKKSAWVLGENIVKLSIAQLLNVTNPKNAEKNFKFSDDLTKLAVGIKDGAKSIKKIYKSLDEIGRMNKLALQQNNPEFKKQEIFLETRKAWSKIKDIVDNETWKKIEELLPEEMRKAIDKAMPVSATQVPQPRVSRSK